LPKGKWIDYDTGREYLGPQILKDFKIPVEKIPLFVGGTGIMIEDVDGELKGRIYPVTDKASTTFYGKDGKSKSVIYIENPDWDNFEIIDLKTGSVVDFEKVRSAFQFNLIEGHDYRIK
jgi:alpha-glucosidase (family GH31 glycosyl hydrolase)